MNSLLSFGAGVQTTALLVLVATGEWPRPDAIVFADTGVEYQATYDYLSDVSGPYAKQHGLVIITLGPEWRTPHYQADLEQYCLDHRMLPGTWIRWCTNHYKIQVIAHYRKQMMGATTASPTETWIGISVDESRRAVLAIDPTEVKRYPLIELGMSRLDCESVIISAGLAVPPKSGCWFCPFQKQARWHQLKRERPDLFDRALQLERNAQGKGAAKKYLPMFGSLERVAAQDELPGFDECIKAESGCVAGSCFV